MRVRQHPPAPQLTGGPDDNPAWNDAPCRDLTLTYLWDLELDNNGAWGLAETREARHERHREAKRMCMDCPALHLCKRLDTTGRQGVIAGRVVT